MKNTTIGRYIPGNSVIHRLDPRIKLITNIIFIVLVFIATSFVMEAILIIPVLFAFILSKLQKKQLISMMKPAILIGVFLLLVNSFLMGSDPTGDWEYAWKSFTINYHIVRQTLIIILRIYTMILITSLLTSTTKPMALTKAIEDLLLPLKLLRIPVRIIAMIISIALRFIPTLLEEAQRIMKAQASRGVDFKNGGIKSKAKSMITLIIPLFVSAFSKAEDLGNAMETRGYNPYEKRTRYRVYRISLNDIISMMIMISLVCILAITRNSIIEVPMWWNA